MAELVDGWFTFAVRDPGPRDRAAQFGFAHTDMDTVTHHSLEGWFNPVNTTGHNEMKNPDRFPTAWHWTVTRRPCLFQGTTYPAGTVFQHYDARIRLQHGNAANTRGPGGETEGLYDMPLLPEQVAAWLRIHRALRAATGKPFLREPGSGRGLIEHREVGQTACPSERYAPLWAAVEAAEEDNMTEDQVRAIFRQELARVAEEERQSALGSTVPEAVGALVKRQRAMGRARSLEQVIKANDPEVVPE